MKYRCSICGKDYDTVKERAACEMTCAEKSERAAEEKRKKQLEAQKEARNKVINEKLTEVVDLMVKYNKDYGEDPYIKINSNGVNFDWTSKKYNSTFERKSPFESTANKLFDLWLNTF